jgi:hypothetical protein
MLEPRGKDVEGRHELAHGTAPPDGSEKPKKRSLAAGIESRPRVHDDDLFPTLSPGYLLAALPPSRARQVVDQYEELTDSQGARDPKRKCRAILGLMTDEELRKIARTAGMPADGHFISLYHRLTLLC